MRASLHLLSTYVEGFEMPPRSDTRQHEEMRRADGTGRDYHLLPRTHLRQRVVAEKLYAIRSSVSYQYLRRSMHKTVLQSNSVISTLVQLVKLDTF